MAAAGKENDCEYGKKLYSNMGWWIPGEWEFWECFSRCHSNTLGGHTRWIRVGYLDNGRGRSWWCNSRAGLRRRRSKTIAIHLSLRAFSGDVASLAASVAGLASGVEGTSVGSSAVAGDVAQLATGVALHGLSLAVTSVVVGSTTLVAGSRSWTTSETSSEATGKPSAGDSGTTSHSSGTRVRARALFNRQEGHAR